jgi:hypothetical protein
MGYVKGRHVAVIKDGKELTVQRFIVKMSVIADLMALVLVQITANVV